MLLKINNLIIYYCIYFKQHKDDIHTLILWKVKDIVISLLSNFKVIWSLVAMRCNILHEAKNLFWGLQ